MLAFFARFLPVQALGGIFGRIDPKLIAGIVLVLAVYWVGYSRADNSANLDALEAANRKLQLELTTHRQANATANRHIIELEALKQDHQEKIDALQADLAQRPDRGVCALSDDDARRLRDIR